MERPLVFISLSSPFRDRSLSIPFHHISLTVVAALNDSAPHLDVLVAYNNLFIFIHSTDCRPRWRVISKKRPRTVQRLTIFEWFCLIRQETREKLSRRDTKPKIMFQEHSVRSVTGPRDEHDAFVYLELVAHLFEHNAVVGGNAGVEEHKIYFRFRSFFTKSIYDYLSLPFDISRYVSILSGRFERTKPGSQSGLTSSTTMAFTFVVIYNVHSRGMEKNKQTRRIGNNGLHEISSKSIAAVLVKREHKKDKRKQMSPSCKCALKISLENNSFFNAFLPILLFTFNAFWLLSWGRKRERQKARTRTQWRNATGERSGERKEAFSHAEVIFCTLPRNKLMPNRIFSFICA